MAEQSEFGAKLATLCQLEVLKASRNPERAADMIERQCNAIGMTIAMMADGDSARAQELLTGMEQYIYDAVAQYSPLAKLAAMARK